MEKKYSIQKYILYNNVLKNNKNIFEYENSIKFIIEFINTILYRNPNVLNKLINRIQQDLLNFNSRENSLYIINELTLMNNIITQLDTKLKYYEIFLNAFSNLCLNIILQ